MAGATAFGVTLLPVIFPPTEFLFFQNCSQFCYKQDITHQLCILWVHLINGAFGRGTQSHRQPTLPDPFELLAKWGPEVARPSPAPQTCKQKRCLFLCQDF